MEDKSSNSRSLLPRKSFGLLDWQDSMHVIGPQMPHPFQGFMASSRAQAPDVFCTCEVNARKSDGPPSFFDCHGKAEVTKNSCNKNSSYVVGDHKDRNDESEKEKEESPWQCVKWTDQMVKLLITAVSYTGEDAFLNCYGGGRRISPLLLKKGKWKAISKVMAERGYHVSPQQCEDKFNDLSKRYKKLNDILGRGTCEIVENPALLNVMDMSDKAKERVRKILSSKHLFYQEMCSYHNGNQLYIPHDQAILRSLQLALSSDDPEFHEAKTYRSDGIDGEEGKESIDCSNDNTKEKHSLNKDLAATRVSAKRKKPAEHHYSKSGYILNLELATKCSSHDHTRMNQVSGDGVEGECQGGEWFISRSLQFEEQKLQIEAEMLELEKQRFRWLRSSELEDRGLEKMRLENECIKLKNEHLTLEINCRQMGPCDN